MMIVTTTDVVRGPHCVISGAIMNIIIIIIVIPTATRPSNKATGSHNPIHTLYIVTCRKTHIFTPFLLDAYRDVSDKKKPPGRTPHELGDLECAIRLERIRPVDIYNILYYYTYTLSY